MKKLCVHCGFVKDLEMFGRATHVLKSGERRPKAWCKLCEALKSRNYRLTEAQKQKKRWSNRRKVTFWTEELVDAAWEAQGGLCNICKVQMTNCSRCGKFSLNADHDPSTHKPRALLCRRCNAGLGQFQENSGLLRKAADYLDFHNPSDSSLERTTDG